MQTATATTATSAPERSVPAPLTASGADFVRTASTSRTAAPSTSRAVRGASRSLGHQLERDRLEQRAARVRQVIVALRERAAAREGRGGAPRPLTAAIEDFGRELADLERRLRHASR